MYVEVNECVNCPAGMGCYGDSCPQKHVVRCYCDQCKDEIYENDITVINNEHYCPICAEEYADDMWNNLTLAEKIELIGR